MTLAYDDLPAGRLRDAVRAADERGEGRPVGRTASARARPLAESKRRARRRYRCGSCSNVESSYRAAERHADTHGGARIDLDLEAVS